MNDRRDRGSRAGAISAFLRGATILAGIVCMGRWGVWSLGGDIQNGYLVAAIALFSGAYALSFLL